MEFIVDATHVVDQTYGFGGVRVQMDWLLISFYQLNCRRPRELIHTA